MEQHVVKLIHSVCDLAKIAGVETIIIDKTSVRGNSQNVIIFDQKPNDLGDVDIIGISRVETLLQRINAVTQKANYTVTPVTDKYTADSGELVFLRSIQLKASRAKVEYRFATPRLIRMFKRITVADIAEIELASDAVEQMVKSANAMGAGDIIIYASGTELWSKAVDINGDAFELQIGTIVNGALAEPSYTYPIKELAPLLKRAAAKSAITDKGLWHLMIDGFSVYFNKKV